MIIIHTYMKLQAWRIWLRSIHTNVFLFESAYIVMHLGLSIFIKTH